MPAHAGIQIGVGVSHSEVRTNSPGQTKLRERGTRQANHLMDFMTLL